MAEREFLVDKMEIKSIKTVLGDLQGRDDLFLQKLDMNLYPIEIKCHLRLNNNIKKRLPENTNNSSDVVILKFLDVKIFNVSMLDYSKLEKFVKSRFDEVINSETLKLNKLDLFKHFILSTYDHVIEVIAKDFLFEQDLS
jgi:hypothetical protein